MVRKDMSRSYKEEICVKCIMSFTEVDQGPEKLVQFSEFLFFTKKM